MKTSTDFARLLSRFLTDYLQHERNLSPNTIASYRDTFVQLVTYMREVCKIGVERLGLGDLTKDNVTGFLSWLESKSESASRHGTAGLRQSMRLYPSCNMSVLTDSSNGS